MGQGRRALGYPRSLGDTLEVALLAPGTIQETLQTILKSDPVVLVGHDEIGPRRTPVIPQ